VVLLTVQHQEQVATVVVERVSAQVVDQDQERVCLTRAAVLAPVISFFKEKTAAQVLLSFDIQSK
jgi:hypothetical protein